MFHVKRFNFQQHCLSVGQYLRELRIKRDLSTADISIICAHMEADFLHSSIAVVHSSYIRRMLQTHKTPFRIAMYHCPYSAVSAVIDWMYTGELQLSLEEYAEYLKVVNNLGVKKLQQNLEDTLQQLAAQNNCLIHCINIATDPECLVSSIARGIICGKFIANMHTLSDSDIQKLTSDAIMTLISSPRIKSNEKIDTVNFALQWLKNADHIRHLDPVLGSLYIETLHDDQLLALVQHLRRLYRELPANLLAPIHLYRRGKRVVVSGDPKKYAKTSNVIVPTASSESDSESEEHTSAEAAQLIGPELSASHIDEIKQMLSFDEQIQQNGNESSWRLKQTNIYRPTSSGSQELINARAFTSEDLAEHRQIPDLFAKHRLPLRDELSQHSNTTSSRSSLHGGIGTDTLRQYASIPSFSDKDALNGAPVTAPRAPSTITVNRHVWGSQSLEDIRALPSQFSCFNGSGTSGSRSIQESQSSTESQKFSMSGNKSLLTATEENGTLGRYEFGSESLSEIRNLPEQFSDRSALTKGSLDTRLAAAGTSDEKSAETIGRRSFGSHSLADISDIPNQFTRSSESVRTAASAEERTVGRYAFGSDSFAELQDIPSAFPLKSRRRSCETLNRRAFGPESVVEINRLPILFSSRSPYQRAPAEKSQSPSAETINRYAYGVESVADISHLPMQFYGKRYFTPDPVHYPGGRRAVYNLTEQIRQMKEKQYSSDLYFKQGYGDFRSAENGASSGQHSRETDLQTVNRFAFGEQSLVDICGIPSQFSAENYGTARGTPPSEVSNRRSYGSESLADIRAIPDQFSQKGSSVGYPTLVSSQELINRRLLSAQSLSDIHSIPEQFPNPGFPLRSPSQEALNRRMFGQESLADIHAIPEQFTRGRGAAMMNCHVFNTKAPMLGSRNRRAFSCEVPAAKAATRPISYQEWRRNMERRSEQQSSSSERSASSLGSLVGERSFGTSHTSHNVTSLEDHMLHPLARYNKSEILDINAHPEFVREDHVIGKKALTREEHEELRGIPPITAEEPVKLPIVNRYELSDEEQQDIKNLPDIVGSQYTIGRHLRSEEEIRELQALPDIHSGSRGSASALFTAREAHSRPSFESFGTTSPGLSSAYVASDMHSRRYMESPVSSEYLMHGAYGTHEKRMY